MKPLVKGMRVRVIDRRDNKPIGRGTITSIEDFGLVGVEIMTYPKAFGEKESRPMRFLVSRKCIERMK